MKRIIISSMALVALSTSAMALDLLDKDESVVVRVAMDVEGSQNDSEFIVLDTAGSPCNQQCGKYGADYDAAFEISAAFEEEVADGEFGSNKVVTYYDRGDAKIFNGKYLTTNVSDRGLEFTYEVFYKFNQYFKPFVGAGFGINQEKVDYQRRDGKLPSTSYDRDRTEYTPTVNAVVGITGEVFAGIGYYANYKYRLADSSSTTTPAQINNVWTNREIKIDHLDSGQFLAGISYKF